MKRLRSLAWVVLALSIAPALAFAGGPFDSGLTSSAISLGGASGSVTCNTSPCLVLGTNTITTSGATISPAELNLLDGHTSPLVDTAYGGSLALSDLTTSGYLTASGVYAPSAPSTFAGITTTTIAGTSQTLSGNLVVTGSVTAGSIITGTESGVTLASPTVTGTATLTGATIANGTFTGSSLTSPTLTGTAAGANLTLSGRLQCAFGANVASANTITLGDTGNTFVITGTTQINAITTTGWQDGSEIRLYFIDVVLLKYNTAGTGTSAPLNLQNGHDVYTHLSRTHRFVLGGGTRQSSCGPHTPRRSRRAPTSQQRRFRIRSRSRACRPYGVSPGARRRRPALCGR